MFSQTLQPGCKNSVAEYADQFEATVRSIEPNIDTFSQQSSPTRCGSTTGDFGPGNHPLIYPDVARRMSFVSSTSLSPSWASTSATPITPISIKDEQGAMDGCSQNSGAVASQFMPHIFDAQGAFDWNENIELDESLFWQPNMLPDVSCQPVQPPADPSYSQQPPPSCRDKNNPALTRQIFPAQDQGMNVMNESVGESVPSWMFPDSISPPTIAPGETFRPAYPTSSAIQHEPSTPIRNPLLPSVSMSSSSFETYSPPVLPSQHDISDVYHDVDEYLTSPIPRRSRSTVDRLQRRSYQQRRNAVHAPRSVTSRSGIECDELIPHNEFNCSHEGCHKRFKRQEHRKRHELTVHDKKKSFKCWVPGCKTAAFTRTDNLKSHQKNTHGTKKATQRNRYVATLDEKSKWYDPSWIGDLTDEGIPIRPRKVQS